MQCRSVGEPGLFNAQFLRRVSPKCHKPSEIGAWPSEAGFQQIEISDSLMGNLIRTHRGCHAFADPFSHPACRDRRPSTRGRQALPSPARRAVRHTGHAGRGQLVPCNSQLHRCPSRPAARLFRVALAARAGLQHDPLHSPAIGSSVGGAGIPTSRRRSPRAGRRRVAAPCRHRRQGIASQLQPFPGPQGRTYFERVRVGCSVGAGASRL